MSRLITYDKNQKRYFHKFSTDGFDTLFQKICAKLYAFEELEDKLGCPLEFYFNLKTSTEIIDKSNNEWFLSSIINHKIINCYKETEVYNHIGIGKLKTIYKKFKIKDYQKTWWLKGDSE